MGRGAAVVGAVGRAGARAAYSPYAVDGATARDVVAEQIPAWRARAGAGARYDVGCLYVGVNDVRGFDWDPQAYARDLTAALRDAARGLRARADPDDPARPRPAPRGGEGRRTPTR